MSVDVDILTTNIAGALVVPTAAVTRDGKNAFVYVIRNGKAVKTPVKTGASNDMETIVRSGLAPGQVVIAEKNPLVHDGAAVSPAPKASASPAV
jgi:macrolide-specific efflux system membrane fusion protein